MTKPVCVVAGVGPGNGAALGRKFADSGYTVALLARDEEKLKALAQDISKAGTYRCDLSDSDSVAGTFSRIKQNLGPVSVLVYNAGGGQWGHVEQTTPDDFEKAWRVNAYGCLLAAHQVIPDMLTARRGNIVVIGATASLRGGANFTAFASAKAAQRNLAQSMARHLGPRGIHVSYVIIDGVVDLPRTRERLSDKPDEFFLCPDDIAESVLHLTRQQKSAWSFEIDLRPFAEKW